MPILEDDDFDDRAVLWSFAGVDAEGQPVFDEPEEIWVNWQQRRRVETGPDGTKVYLDASVTVDRYIPTDSRLWLAPDHTEDALVQWYESGSAGQTDEVMKVQTQSKTRDIKAIETRFTVGLVWDRDV